MGLYCINLKLMSAHWSVWKPVLALDEELEDPDAKWKGPINQWMDIHHSGTLIARTHNDGTVELWDLMAGEQRWRRGTAAVTESSVYSETRAKYVGFKGDLLYVLSGEKLIRYSLDGEVLAELPLKTGAKVSNPEGSSVLVASSQGESSMVIDLKTFKTWLVPGVMEMASGMPRVDMSSDGRMLMLGDRGQVKVISMETGSIVYEWNAEPIKIPSNGTANATKQVINKMDKRSVELEREIAQNTERRNSLPTEARMTSNGKMLILLFSNHLDEADPSKKKTRIQAVDIERNDLLWESVREGKCDEIHFEGDPGTFCIRQMRDNLQVLVRYDVNTGTVMNEIPFTVVKDRPVGGAEVQSLGQEHFYLDPRSERVVFCGQEPWIAKVGEMANLFPLYVSKADVPLAKFSEDGNLVATYSASGVVRVFYLFGKETEGYKSHPLGWLMFFSWIIWSVAGMIILWKWGKDSPGMRMPGWLGVMLCLLSLHIAYHFTDAAALHAESLAEEPWDSTRLDLVMFLLLSVGLIYFTLYWMIRGARWSRIILIVMISIKGCLLMLSALHLIGFMENLWHPWEHKLWGTQVTHASTGYITYILATWLGSLVCLVILLSKDCSQWCTRLTEQQREKTLRELGQAEAVYQKASS